ncbi:hypothetical protein A2U01_0076971 [Trifolium medium]|uniref:Uncharacterized protein n=1 Tax=Trifolium medium TaxID=97028 RepID=A0A392T6D4_9FABA|nr:hypothetical protein [Trifolium medium]
MLRIALRIGWDAENGFVSGHDAARRLHGARRRRVLIEVVASAYGARHASLCASRGRAVFIAAASFVQPRREEQERERRGLARVLHPTSNLE